MNKLLLYAFILCIGIIIIVLIPRHYKHNSIEEYTIELPVDSVHHHVKSIIDNIYDDENEPHFTKLQHTDSTKNNNAPPLTHDSISIAKPSVYQGKLIKHTDLPNNPDLNSRLWISEFYNTFNEGDYISGEELGLHYKNNKDTKAILRSSFYNFFKNNIDSIVRRKNNLIIRTKKVDGINTSLKIPLLVSFECNVKDSAQVTFNKTLISTESQFEGWHLLPMQLNGLLIIQKGDTIPTSGYIYNNYYLVNYPNSQQNYKFK